MNIEVDRVRTASVVILAGARADDNVVCSEFRHVIHAVDTLHFHLVTELLGEGGVDVVAEIRVVGDDENAGGRGHGNLLVVEGRCVRRQYIL